MSALRVLQVAAEVFPLVKTGGLGDVMAALPPALAASGDDVRLLVPGYPAVLAQLRATRVVATLGPAFGAAQLRVIAGISQVKENTDSGVFNAIQYAVVPVRAVAEQLRETTMAPESRTLMQVTIDDRLRWSRSGPCSPWPATRISIMCPATRT